MDLEKAFKNLVEAARVFKGTFDEHEALQLSLKIISEKLWPIAEEKKEGEEK